MILSNMNGTASLSSRRHAEWQVRSVNGGHSFYSRTGVDVRYSHGSVLDGARAMRELPRLADHKLNSSQFGTMYAIIKNPNERESSSPFWGGIYGRGQGNLAGTTPKGSRVTEKGSVSVNAEARG